jgi:sec-independent protein translocase protein TatA
MGTGLTSPSHLLILLLVVLLVYGPRRLPEMGRSLGRGIRDFKTHVSEEHPEIEDAEITPARALPVADPREHDSI